MRPVLPLRNLLLRTLSPPDHLSSQLVPSTSSRPLSKPPNKSFTMRLVSRARTHVSRGELCAFTRVLRDVATAPRGVDPHACMRAVVVNAVGEIARRDGRVVEELMAVLTDGGGMEYIDDDGMGVVVDLVVRGMLWRGDVKGALKGEMLARMLDLRLRRGTYTMLMEQVGLELRLGILHRAVAVGVQPGRAMLHTVLRACLERNDVDRARRVMAEMDRRGVRMNCETVTILLQRADDVDGVDSVLNTVLNGGCRLSARLGGVFVEAFLKVGAVKHAFKVIDLFYERGVGIESWAMERLVVGCVRKGMIGGGLRAWREMRRAWMGGVGMKGKKALWGVVGDGVREKLGVRKDELEVVWRYALGIVDDADVDERVLAEGGPRERATVLHRWARKGRLADVARIIDSWVDEEGGVDVRVLMAALSETKERVKALEFCVKHLGRGSVVGNKEEVVRRALEGIWAWISRGGGDVDDEGMKMEKWELADYLDKIVRVQLV